MVFDLQYGEKRAKKFLLGAYKNNKIASAYLFYGQNIDVMLYFAKEFAKLLNCQTVCGNCLNCKKIESNFHPDFISVLSIGKKETIKIDQIREVIERAHIGPTEGRYLIITVVIPTQFEEEAANCALKILEEPPQNVVIILVAKNKDAVPKTVLSRCQCVYFSSEEVFEKKSFDFPNTKNIYNLFEFASQMYNDLSDDEDERKKALSQLKSLLFNFYEKKQYFRSNLVSFYLKAVNQNANIKMAFDHLSLSLGGWLK